MDIFCEYMVKRKKEPKDTFIIFGSIVLGIILSFAVLLFLMRYIAAIAVLVVVGIWYGVAYIIRSTDVEYEYILTNSVMDIDKIMAKKSRKRVVRNLDFKEVTRCAPTNGEPLPEEPGIKVLDYSGDITDKSVYYVDFNKNGENTRMYFKPNAKILKNIKTENPRGVTVNPEDIM